MSGSDLDCVDYLTNTTYWCILLDLNVPERKAILHCFLNICSEGDLVLSFQDREGMDVDVVRAVRLWYSPAAAELAIDLKPEENESRLGVGISCTEEVFNPFFHLWPSLFLDISYSYVEDAYSYYIHFQAIEDIRIIL